MDNVKVRKTLHVGIAERFELFWKRVRGRKFADGEVALATYRALAEAADALTQAREDLRVVLLDWIKKEGEDNHLALGRYIAIREERKSSTPNELLFHALCLAKGIPQADFTKTITKTLLDVAKIDALIRAGKLDAAEVDKMKERSFALKVQLREEP